MFIFTGIIHSALGVEAVRNYFFDTVKGKALKVSKGLYPAPLKIADVRNIIVFSHLIKKKLSVLFWQKITSATILTACK